MVNINEEVYQKLTECNADVVYNFPSDFSRLPIISYSETENADSGICEEEIICNVSYQIDVWANDIEDVVRICLQVDEKMKETGFRRAFAQDMSENNIVRKTMRYAAKINTRTMNRYKM